MTPVASVPVRLGILPPLRGPVYFCLFNITWTWLASSITGNVSQVDRVWTFLPTLYTTWFTFYPNFESTPSVYAVKGVSERACLLWGLQVLWMFRLSYNTWRRGLFSLSDEDYRWEILRRKIPKWLFQVFNLAFISIIQNILLFMLGLPSYQVLMLPKIPLGLSDYIIGGLSLTVLTLEFIADNQQWSFQNFKQSGKIKPNEWFGANIEWTEHDRKRGFITRGLWAWSRHPNFFCEQSFWILTSCFSVFASSNLQQILSQNSSLLIPLIPAISLCTLFFSSTKFSESITKQKYTKAYTAYQSRVGMFVPLMTGVKGLYWKVRGGKSAREVDELIWGDSTEKQS